MYGTYVVYNTVDTLVREDPREFEKVVVTRAGRLQECALVSNPMVKQ